MIFFRCDAGSEAGLGHLVRSINLGIEISKISGYRPNFIINSSEKIISKYLDRKYFNLIFSETRIGTDDDYKFLKKYLTEDCLIILDSRFVRQKDIDNLSKSFFLIGIDDGLNELNWPIKLNYNLYAEGSNSNDLIGPTYNLINSKFFSPNKNNKYTPRILITMGGEDPDNLTSWIIENSAEILNLLDVRIIIGAAHPDKIKVRQQTFKYLSEAEIFDSPESLIEHAIWSNIAITAGGMSAYELAASENALIGIAIESHQIQLLKSMDERGALEFIGEYDHNTKKKLTFSLRKLIDNRINADKLRKSAKKLFPRPGARLAASKILNLWRG